MANREIVICVPVRTAIGTYNGSLKNTSAVKQALGRAGWKISNVERFEINEPISTIALAVMRDLGFAEDIVNVEGNSIANGHPIGATGALQTTRLLHSMQRDRLKRGIVTMCIGGGEGIALCLESVN